MTIREQVINKLINEGKLKEYNVINLGFSNFYLKYGTNIVRYNELPTLTTQSSIAIVLKEDVNE